MKVVAVLGLSGVGKSTLVRKAGERKNILHLVASDLIKARLSQTSEQLRQGAVWDNQALMLAEFADRLKNAGSTTIVFDGHSIIDTPDGLLEIPLSVFQAISPSAIVFIEAWPEVIAQRRASDTGRTRPARSAAELAQHQEIAKRRASLFAAELGAPFVAIASDDVEHFLALL